MTRITRGNRAQTLVDITQRPVFSASTTQTLTVAVHAENALNILTGSSAVTWTLPAPAGASGAVIPIKNQSSATLTLASASGSQIFTTAAVASTTVATGASIRLICDGTYWNTVD